MSNDAFGSNRRDRRRTRKDEAFRRRREDIDRRAAGLLGQWAFAEWSARTGLTGEVIREGDRSTIKLPAGDWSDAQKEVRDAARLAVADFLQSGEAREVTVHSAVFTWAEQAAERELLRVMEAVVAFCREAIGTDGKAA